VDNGFFVLRRHPLYNEYASVDGSVALYLRRDLEWHVRAVLDHTVLASLGRILLIATY